MIKKDRLELEILSHVKPNPNPTFPLSLYGVVTLA